MGDFRRPESVLVVVYTARLECLLLERADPRGFWQSVTGTLRPSETPAAAAVREVREETGLVCAAPKRHAVGAPGPWAGGAHSRQPPMLRETKTINRFPILSAWRHRYAPGVTENREHLLYLEVPAAGAVTLNSDEHVAYRWMGLEEAIVEAASWTNREALERLRTSTTGRR